MNNVKRIVENMTNKAKRELLIPERAQVNGWLFIALAFQLAGFACALMLKWQQQYFESFSLLIALNIIALFFCFMAMREKQGSFLDGFAVIFERFMTIQWDIRRDIERKNR
jgi:hypothetical protein